jgi:hypothetical protein
MSLQSEFNEIEDYFLNIRVCKETGCHLWEGSISPNGYGVHTFYGLTQSTHRWAWEEANGAIPEGFNILHECDVKRCVNPEHMEIGTQQQNMDQKVARGRINQNPRPRRKVTSEEVAAMAKMYSAGSSWYRIGIEFDRSQQQVKQKVERFLGTGSAVSI